MKNILGLSFAVQGALFLGILIAIYHYGFKQTLPIYNEPASTMLCVVSALGFLESSIFALLLFIRKEVKNDGRLIIVLAQATLLPWVIWQSWYGIIIVALPSFFMYKFWQENLAR